MFNPNFGATFRCKYNYEDCVKPFTLAKQLTLYISERYHMAYKLVKTECKLVRSILGSHGLHEVQFNN